jgi:hypothetical protein
MAIGGGDEFTSRQHFAEERERVAAFLCQRLMKWFQALRMNVECKVLSLDIGKNSIRGEFTRLRRQKGGFGCSHQEGLIRPVRQRIDAAASCGTSAAILQTH